MIPAAALVEIPQKSWKSASTAIYSASFAAMGITFSILGPTLPALAAQTHTSLTTISYLFIARSIGSIIGSIGGGRLFDRLAGHLLVAGTMAIMIATLVVIPMIPQIWMLTAVLFLAGVTNGTLNVGGNVLLIWVHGSKVAPFMNALHFFFGLGTFVAPIVVAQVVLLTGEMRWAYWLLALVSLPIVLLTLGVRSPEPQHRSGQPGNEKIDLGLVLGFFLIFFGYSGAAQAYGGWIFTYVTRLGLANDSAAAYLNSIFWGALMAGRLLSIPLTVRFSPKAMLRADLLGALISLGLVSLFPRSLIAIGVGSAGLGFSLATIFPTNMSLASRYMAITGKITGWFSIGSSLGALVLPWLVGQLFEPAGPELLIYLNLGNILLTLGAYFYLVKRLEKVGAQSTSQGGVPAPPAPVREA